MIQKESLRVKANEFEFFIEEDRANNASVIQVGEGSYNILFNGKSVNVTVLNPQGSGKSVHTIVNGIAYEINIEDQLDQMLHRMGYNSNTEKQVKEIKAPMPGLVREISVAEEQDVVDGDRILILEAMKMENSILIHGNGKIKKILVKAGDAVEKLQKLVELY